MRSNLGRFHRPMSRGLVNNMLTMNNLGDGSTLSLDFTTGVLDPRLTFSRAGGGTYVGPDGYIYGIDSATSSSLPIGTGSKSVTLTATAGVNRRFEVGQTVYFSNGANNMSGLVTAYSPSTQVITINATSSSGSGSFTSWFVGNASARFDYDPTTLTPRGLLIEAAASNLLKYSSYADTNWIAFGGYSKSYTTNITSPANDTSAACVTFSAVGHGLYTNNTQMGYTNTVGATYTMSAWIRATSNTTNLNIRFGDSAVASSPNIPITTTWTRYSYSYVAVSASGPTVQSASGTATGEFEMWGFQLEAGSGASSYIPTGASQGSRAADTCYLTDFAGWSAGGNFNTAEGTLFVDQAVTFVGTANYPAGGFCTSNTAGSRFAWQYRQGDAPQGYRGLVNAGYLYELPVGAGWSIPSGTTRFRHAMSCGGGTSAFLRQSFKSSASSGSPTQNNYSDVSTLNISGVAAFTLTQSAFASSVRIARVKYYPRAFTLTELDQLTN